MSAVQVETFECQETAAEPLEATEEAVSIMQELGLDGQLTLVNKKDESRQFATRCPYRHMTVDEVFAYKELCPKSYDIAKYDAAPIPLRVLQIAAHARKVVPSEGREVRLLVWDKEKHEIKDPVLVAEIGDTYRPTARFILARWGEQLEAFGLLFAKAMKSKRERMIAQAKKILGEAENITDDSLMEKSNEPYWY